MLNQRANITLFIALIAIIGLFYLVWRWGASSTPVSQTFSFFAQSEKEKSKHKADDRMPEKLDELMPESPEGIAPPALISFGELTKLHEQKPARGIVKLFKLGTGEHLVRLEGFSVVKGPGLHLYLTAKPAPRNVPQVLEDFIDLGELRSQSGSLNYLIPADIDLNGYQGLVIFTPYFNEIYASASLTTTP